MSIGRREFLRSGMAAAAVTAASGCSELNSNFPPVPAGSWNDVPGILARIVPPEFPARDFVVTDYGAVADGRTNCRPAFAAAILACHKAGGGRVVVPDTGGYYQVDGPIQLLSNVNLFLANDVVVRFGIHPADYLPVVLVRYQGIRCYNYSPLIYAYQQTNIAITGSGIFDGQAFYWDAFASGAGPDWPRLLKMVADGVPVENRIFGAGHHLRLTMFEPYDCKNILVEGVTFRASPFWTLHPTFCTNVTIRNVTIQPGQANDDGCDPDSCTDVLIDGCTIDTHDDNFAIKAGFGPDSFGLAPCQNLVIQNCKTINSNWGGFAIGSNTGSVVQNVFVQNCDIGDCDYAFFVKSSSAVGGAVKNLFIRSCKAANCGLFFSIASSYQGLQGPTPPLFDNLNLENVSCGAVRSSAFALIGDARNPIQYVTFNDIAIESAPNAEQMQNALFVKSSNVTIGGRKVSITGVL